MKTGTEPHNPGEKEASGGPCLCSIRLRLADLTGVSWGIAPDIPTWVRGEIKRGPEES